MKLFAHSAKIMILTALLFSICNAMELHDQNYSIVTYANGQEQSNDISHDNFMLLKEQSNTIKTMFEDLGNQERVIALPCVSHNDLQTLLPLLQKLHNKIKPDLLEQELIEHQPEKLIALINNANYLESRTLLTHSINALVNKIRTLSVNDFKADSIYPTCFTSLPLDIQKEAATALLKPIDHTFALQDLMSPYITYKKSALSKDDVIKKVRKEMLSYLELSENKAYKHTTQDSTQQWAAGVLPNNKTEIKQVTGETKIVLDTDQRNSPKITDVLFSTDAQFLATNHKDMFRIWNIKQNKVIFGLTDASLISNNDTICFACSPDSKLLAITQKDPASTHGILKVWNMQTGERLGTHYQDQIHSLAFSPDNVSLAIGKENELCIVNIDPYISRIYYQCPLTSCCKHMHYDNDMLVATDDKDVIHTWNIPTFSQKFSYMPIGSALLISTLYDNSYQSINLTESPYLIAAFNALPKPIQQYLLKDNKIVVPSKETIS